MKKHSVIFRFRDEQLQSYLINTIENAGLEYKVTDDGIAIYKEGKRIPNFVDKIADAVFPDGWYRAEIPNTATAKRYCRFTKYTGSSIIEEKYNDETWFIQKLTEKLYRCHGIPTHVSFIIAYEDLEPNTITRQLGISPTFACREGESFARPYTFARSYKGAPPLPSQEGLWELCSIPSIESNDVDLHLEWLLNKLEPVASKIKSLAKNTTNEDYRILQVDVVIEKQSIGGISLSDSSMNRLSLLCDRVDIRFWPDDFI